MLIFIGYIQINLSLNLLINPYAKFNQEIFKVVNRSILALIINFYFSLFACKNIITIKIEKYFFNAHYASFTIKNTLYCFIFTLINLFLLLTY
jgi:hypothetical protein